MEAMDTGGSPATAWCSYRCPVCGHTDGALLAGADTILIRCSHCDTPLELSGRAGRQTAAAKVAYLGRPRERAT